MSTSTSDSASTTPPEPLRQIIVAKSGQPLAKDKFIIGVKASAVDLSQLPSGDYTLRPIARNAGGSRLFHVCNYNYTKTNVVRLSVTADSLFFHQAESYDLKADTVTTTKIYRGVTSRATATVHNDGELEYSALSAPHFSTPTVRWWPKAATSTTTSLPVILWP